MTGKVRVGVLISGRGSNLAALAAAANRPDYPAEIALVISNRPGAVGLARAEEAGIATRTIDHTAFASRAAFDDEVDGALRHAGVELVCCAGFLRLQTEGFVEAWRDRQLNIHPSLLPAFRGLDTHRRAIEAGVRFAGCTVHFVRPEMDVGPIVAQAVAPVLPGDTPEGLAERVLAAEHKLYPFALELVASGRARVSGELVEIEGYETDAEPLFGPKCAP